MRTRIKQIVKIIKDCQLLNQTILLNWIRSNTDLSPEKEVVLEVKDYNIADNVFDVNFKLHKGEILGFAGILGSGIHPLLRSIYGISPRTSGEIYFNNKKVLINNSRDAINCTWNEIL